MVMGFIRPKFHGLTLISSAWKALLATDRSFYTVLLGAVFLFVAAVWEWYRIPSSDLSAIDADGLLSIVDNESTILFCFRFASIAVAMLSVLIVLFAKDRTQLIRGPVWFFLVVVLSYPVILHQWQPTVWHDSRIIYLMMDATINDMEIAFIDSQTSWRDFQKYVAVDPVMLLANDDPHDDDIGLDLLALHRQSYLFANFLGYSNSFFNLAGAGWYTAIIGSLCLLLGIHLAQPPLRHCPNRRTFHLFVVSVSIAGLLLGPRIVADVYIKKGDEASLQGRHSDALNYWGEGTRLKPTLKYSFRFQAKVGRVSDILRCDRCTGTLIFEAWKHYSSRRYLSAAQLLEQALEIDHSHPSLRLWISQMYVLSGRQAFNVGQYSLAEEFWWRGLSYVPIDPMAWHGLFLVHTKLRQYREASDYLGQIVALQNFINFKRLTAKSQWYQAKSWHQFALGNYRQAFRNYSLHLNPETW